MPSLEVICLKQREPSDVSHLPFLVEAETELVSHRTPSPLFQADFDQLEGCIYHFLDGGITAYDLLKRDWYHGEDNSGDNVEFIDEYAPAAKSFLQELLSSSPVGQILFTTDYQFGPDGGEKHGPLLLDEFWQLHCQGKIKMNDAYWITAN